MKKIESEKVRRASASAILDDGKVRLGTTSPTFPPARSRPAGVADGGKVRLGMTSPTFPPARSR